ncbi:MAG: hypothetical protein KDK70_23785 [Myxococcales bacterium]|nr:hypothetical protein [Myxococcales bacterium]
MRPSGPFLGSTRRAAALAAMLAVAPGGCGDDGSPSASATDSTGSSGEPTTLDEDSGGPATPCVPLEVRPCYEGPFGTADVGRCRSGAQTCAADGSAWSACEGEVWPDTQERCDTPEDDDCDGSMACESVVEWARSIPGSADWVDVAPDGNIVAAGLGYGISEDLELIDTFVLALDPQGEVRWSQSFVESGVQEVLALEVDGDGQTTLVGRYEGSPDFGGGPLPGAAAYDAFAVRLDDQGQHQWSHGLTTSGYFDAAVGPDGTTYVVGSAISIVHDDQPVVGNFHVAAIDPSGAIAWVTPGSGAYARSEYWFRVAVSGDEVAALMVLVPGLQPELGGMPLDLPYDEPIVVRLSTDGTPLGSGRITEVPPFANGLVHLHARTDGWMTVTGQLVLTQMGYRSHLLLAGLDAALVPRSASLVGTDVLLTAADAYGPGTTLLALEFSGQLMLGPLGAIATSFGQAIAVVDDQGQAQWLELLLSAEYGELRAVATAPDGAVIVTGEVQGLASLAGHAIVGPFIAKLRL